MRHQAIDDMNQAIGPRYQGRPVDELDDEFIVTEIERLRCQGIDAYLGLFHNHINYAWGRREIARVFERDFGLDPSNVESRALCELQRQSPEGWGDAAVRVVQGEDPERWAPYRVLWNEFVRRSLACTGSYPEPRVDGGWGD